MAFIGPEENNTDLRYVQFNGLCISVNRFIDLELTYKSGFQ